MLRRLAFTWLPRILFRLALAVAALLFLLVLLAPLGDNGQERPSGWGRVLALFARDAAIRRTTVASAVGLAVTSCVFFRPNEAHAPSRPRRGPKAPPPPGIAGA